jgi:hypothetical protein
VSTAKKSAYPLYPAGTVTTPPDEVAAGPVPAIVWALTLAAVLTTARSEISTVAAMATLIRVRLWFIRFTFLDVLRLKKQESKA